MFAPDYYPTHPMAGPYTMPSDRALSTSLAFAQASLSAKNLARAAATSSSATSEEVAELLVATTRDLDRYLARSMGASALCEQQGEDGSWAGSTWATSGGRGTAGVGCEEWDARQEKDVNCRTGGDIVMDGNHANWGHYYYGSSCSTPTVSMCQLSTSSGEEAGTSREAGTSFDAATPRMTGAEVGVS